MSFLVGRRILLPAGIHPKSKVLILTSEACFEKSRLYYGTGWYNTNMLLNPFAYPFNFDQKLIHMKKSYIITVIVFCMGFLLFSCEKDTKTPEQIERDKIMAVEDLLRDNQWGFHDLTVSVKFESRAIPLLAGLADENGKVQPGFYDSYTIFGNSNRQLYYTYQFTRDKIMLDTSRTGDFYKVGTYYVVNTSQIRIRPDTSRAMKYNYIHEAEENKFVMTAASYYEQEFIARVNDNILNTILAGRPSDIANTFVNLLKENENVSKAIEQFLYDLIHNKVEEISQSPEEISEKLAKAIVDKLKEIDWEDLLYDKILEFLQNLQEVNPEEKAEEIAGRMAEKIEASLSQSDIYDVILPILEEFETVTLPVLASRISAAVYAKLAEALSEENLYERIYPVWEDLTKADTARVTEVADTLAAIVSARFFNADTLTDKLIPFVQKIEDTPSLKLSKLSQEIIDSVLIPAVDNINEAFPGLELDPDWATVKPILTSLLTAVKAGLSSSTVEEMAASLADGIIGIMDNILQKGFEKAIYSLQEIPPEQAASVIASWIANLVEMVEQPVIDFIEGKLNDIFAKFEAEKAAEELSALIHSKILEIFSEENLHKIILPIIEVLHQVDIERVAKIIAKWIIDSGLIGDNLTEEQLVEALTTIISDLIGKVDPDEVAQKLVDLILESRLVNIADGTILKLVIEIKIYELLGAIAGNINAIDHIEVVIQQK